MNYIDLLLQLCKPFTGAHDKYKTFLEKVNCTYLMTDHYVDKATSLDKLETSADRIKQLADYLRGASGATAPKLSGVTVKNLVKAPAASTSLLSKEEI